MTMKWNDTKFAILGLLTTGCNTGYEIKQMIDNSLNHFWKISYGQIYPTLKILTDNELVTVSTKTQDGKPDRKEYLITKKGEVALQKWLQTPLNNLPAEKNELLLKLFFSRHQDQDSTLTLLNDYYKKLRERLHTYQSIEEMIKIHHQSDEDATYWLMTLDYGKHTTKTAMEWCERTISQIKSNEVEKDE